MALSLVGAPVFGALLEKAFVGGPSFACAAGHDYALNARRLRKRLFHLAANVIVVYTDHGLDMGALRSVDDVLFRELQGRGDNGVAPILHSATAVTQYSHRRRRMHITTSPLPIPIAEKEFAMRLERREMSVKVKVRSLS